MNGAGAEHRLLVRSARPQRRACQILAIVEARAPHGFDNIETVISSVELAESRPAIRGWLASTKPL
jgi:hypothetical protein